MKKMVFTVIVFVFSGIGVFAHAESKTETQCTWKNSRDGYEFEAISSFRNLNSIWDCVNTMAVTVLATEPIRGSTTYNGNFLLKDATGRVITSCQSETIKPMSETEMSTLLGWLFQNRGNYSDDRYIELLRNETWQDLIKTHMRVSCRVLSS